MGKDRIINRFFAQSLVEEAKGGLSSSTGRELLKQRKVTVEGIFALARELYGLRRSRLVGRWKVQIQLWLTAAVINFKRAVDENFGVPAVLATPADWQRLSSKLVRTHTSHRAVT